MGQEYVGGLVVNRNQRYALLISRFNGFIGQQLLLGAKDALQRHGATAEQYDEIWVPGAFELPLVAKKLAGSGKYAAVICLGTIIRGQTPHFDYVAGEAAKGLAAAGMETGVPVIFGVITADTLEQAIDRAGTKAGNKGADAAVTAIEMVNLLAQLK
jgi:6,7-dimethyl-8-ribityllumazine synthase